MKSLSVDNRKGLRARQLSRKQEQLEIDLSNFFLESIQTERSVPLKQFIDGIEKTIITRILDEVYNNQKVAATVMGIKPTTLNEKVKKYNIRLIKKPSIIFRSRSASNRADGLLRSEARQSIDMD